jgi:ribosomal protein L37AE/L43A
VIRRFRQRRRVKRELREEAAHLERQLAVLRMRMRVAERRARGQLDALSAAPPTCPSCGATLVIRTAKKPRYNGAQFWGCSRHPSCPQKVIPLGTYPRAAYAAVTRKKKAPA